VTRLTALLAKYRRAPGVTRQRLYLETVRNVLPALQQVFVFESDHPASVLRCQQTLPGHRRTDGPSGGGRVRRMHRECLLQNLSA
jgi:hypothetical protein